MTIIRAGVIGYPISHSKSPLIHGHWLEHYNIAGTYEAIEISPHHLDEGLRDLVHEGYAGFNVTIPYKEEIFKRCARMDEKAMMIGAVNTVMIEHGRMIGTNTDAFGFIENIKQNSPGFDFTRGPAVVLGAGGAARAVIYGLLQQGVPSIILTNRTAAKAEILRTMSPEKIHVVPWDERGRVLKGANVIINTTALGMKGQEPLDLPLDDAPAGALVTDIVYAPLMTDLLARAAARGNPVVTGIGMLLHQARAGFHLWYGIMPEVTPELEAKVMA
jgi:shikimate dehydrogenase